MGPNSELISDALSGNLPEELQDPWFDQIYPRHIRDLSERHWTPVAVAREAARMLVCKTSTRVLDIGAGVGKFCVVGAMSSDGEFTGVEHRKHLVEVAQKIVDDHQLRNVRMIHGGITEIEFHDYNAFYLFNPFEENLARNKRIDGAVELSAALHLRYTWHVAAQLANMPIGTRVATYSGTCEEIPSCYQCQESAFDDCLQLWVKVRHPVPSPEV